MIGALFFFFFVFFFCLLFVSYAVAMVYEMGDGERVNNEPTTSSEYVYQISLRYSPCFHHCKHFPLGYHPHPCIYIPIRI